jgi:hypothetical protein
MNRDWDADLDHIRKDLDELSLSQQISYVGKSVYSWDAWHPAWEQYLTFKIQQTPSSAMETKDNKYKGFYPIEIALDNMLDMLNGKGGNLQLDPIKAIWHVARIIEGKTNGNIMRNSRIVQKFINNGYKPGFKGFDEVDFKKFYDRNYNESLQLTMKQEIQKLEDDKLAAEAAEAAAAEAEAARPAAEAAAAKAEKLRLIREAIDALSMAETVKIVGIDDLKYNAWPEWHDYLVKTIEDYISDYGDNQNQMLGYLNYQVESLASDSSEDPEKIRLRPNGILEMWSVVKMFAESIKEVKLIQGSDKVQKFIETGLKTPYNGVPQAEFTEFATKYKKKGWFGGVGRKSRKQNKSRKQGKSRKQRKSRK